MLLTPMIGYIQKMFTDFQKPQTYGSELEQYIISHNPNDVCDVERLAREFDQANRGGFYVS